MDTATDPTTTDSSCSTSEDSRDDRKHNGPHTPGITFEVGAPIQRKINKNGSGFIVGGPIQMSFSNITANYPNSMWFYLHCVFQLSVNTVYVYFTGAFTNWDPFVLVAGIQHAFLGGFIFILLLGMFPKKPESYRHPKCILYLGLANISCFFYQLVMFVWTPFFPDNPSITWTYFLMTIQILIVFGFVVIQMIPKSANWKTRLKWWVKVVFHFSDINSDVAMAVALISSGQIIELAVVVLVLAAFDTMGLVLKFISTIQISPLLGALVALLGALSEIPVIISSGLFLQHQTGLDMTIGIVSIATSFISLSFNVVFGCRHYSRWKMSSKLVRGRGNIADLNENVETKVRENVVFQRVV